MMKIKKLLCLTRKHNTYINNTKNKQLWEHF